MITRILTLNTDKSLFLFGSRQTGKSTLIRELLKDKKHIKIDLLKRKDFELMLTHPEALREQVTFAVKNNKLTFVFIDEIQKLPPLLDEVHALIEDFPNVKFILTGSSARKLKRGAANLLGGRALSHYLFPFIFSEIKDHAQFQFEEVLKFGSLAGIFFDSPKTKIRALTTYAQTYLKEEIQAEAEVRQLAAFVKFLELAAFQSGEIINYTHMARECHVSIKTIQSYYEILEDTLIIYKIPAWAGTYRKTLVTHPKFYFFDNGIQNALTKSLLMELSPQIRGRLFEQRMIQEIKALLTYHQSPYDIYYFRTHSGLEIDCLLGWHNKIYFAFEFKAKSRVEAREVKALLEVLSYNPEMKAYVICECANPYEIVVEQQKVLVLPWQDFLLDKKIWESLPGGGQQLHIQ